MNGKSPRLRTSAPEESGKAVKSQWDRGTESLTESCASTRTRPVGNRQLADMKPGDAVAGERPDDSSANEEAGAEGKIGVLTGIRADCGAK